MPEIDIKEYRINEYAAHLWRNYQTGQGSADRSQREVFTEVVLPLIRKIFHTNEAQKTPTNTSSPKCCDNCGVREGENNQIKCFDWPECSLTYNKWRPKTSGVS